MEYIIRRQGDFASKSPSRGQARMSWSYNPAAEGFRIEIAVARSGEDELVV
jgi:hypothetical protein